MSRVCTMRSSVDFYLAKRTTGVTDFVRLKVYDQQSRYLSNMASQTLNIISYEMVHCVQSFDQI